MCEDRAMEKNSSVKDSHKKNLQIVSYLVLNQDLSLLLQEDQSSL